MYASKVFQSIRFSTSRLSTAVCSALTGPRVCMMGWTVGKPKLKPWPRRKRCCQARFEFFDHTRTRVSLPQRPAIFGLVALSEKTRTRHGPIDGDDGLFARLCGLRV